MFARSTMARVRCQRYNTKASDVWNGALERFWLVQPGRICISTGHRRFRSASRFGWNAITGARRRSTDWIHFPDRKHAGISEPEGLRRIRRGQPPIGLEHVVNLLDLTRRTFSGRAASLDLDQARLIPAFKLDHPQPTIGFRSACSR